MTSWLANTESHISAIYQKQLFSQDSKSYLPSITLNMRKLEVLLVCDMGIWYKLPINYQSNYSVCYHSDYQFGSYAFVDSPIDYFLGQLCPIFCVCKSTSYDAKCLKTSNLREFPRPPNMNIYNSISAHITAYSNTECITSKPKMYYLSSVYKDADKVFVLKINNLQDVLPQINR